MWLQPLLTAYLSGSAIVNPLSGMREGRALRCWAGVLVAMAFLMMSGCSIKLPGSSFAAFKGSAEKTGSIRLPEDKAQQEETGSIKLPERNAPQEQSI